MIRLLCVIAALYLGLSQKCLCLDRPNVLLLMMDDLRPNMEFLRGDPSNGFTSPPLHTPNLDALAGRSLVLNRAYVQQAICAPSRTSLLTGRRPDTTRVYDFHAYWRDTGGNFTTLPQYFKQHGYTSIGIGKIFHAGHSSHNNDPVSWSVPTFDGVFNFESLNNSWEAIPDDLLEDKPLVDEQIANEAILTMRNLSAGDNHKDKKPFFLAVGFHKPHLPFVCPESIMDMYPVDSIRLPENPHPPVDMPEIAWHRNYMFSKYRDLRKLKLSQGINGSVPDWQTLELRRAYYCALTWADRQLGRVVDELGRLGLADNTVVAFLSDHGYQLGEHGEWTKFNNFELALRAPLMIHIPGRTKTMIKTEQLVEFVDIYPTLVEATGLPLLPLCPEDSSRIEACSEGVSFLPLIENPELPIRRGVFSQNKRTADGAMGYSVRTSRYRYNRWVPFDFQNNKATWSPPIGEELYDHFTDPEENRNVAGHLKYSSVTVAMRQLLGEGWRSALYPGEMMHQERLLLDLELTVLESPDV